MPSSFSCNQAKSRCKLVYSRTFLPISYWDVLFYTKKFDDPPLSSLHDIKPVMVDHADSLEEQPVPMTIDGGLVPVRTKKGFAEVAKRSMQISFRHCIIRNTRLPVNLKLAVDADWFSTLYYTDGN